MAGIYAVLNAGILYLMTCPNDESNPDINGGRSYLCGRYIEMCMNATVADPRIISAEQTRELNIVYKLYRKE